MQPGLSQSRVAYEKLREWIRTGKVVPGQPLSESVLARAFGMSRTPVREAVLRLQQEGLLKVLPARGILVSSLTVEDVEEIISIRGVLEGLASRLAASRSDGEAVQHLESVQEDAQKALLRGDLARLSRLDDDFHEGVAMLSANRRLQVQLANMRDSGILDRFADRISQQRLAQSLEEHDEIVRAIAQRDSDVAEQRMRKHAHSWMVYVISDALGSGRILGAST